MLVVRLRRGRRVLRRARPTGRPFAPNGFHGILAGASLIFFAYIGFDAVSTTAEEAKNPQRDLPRGMIASLVICTVLYIAVTAVLTGMVPSSELGVGDPLARGAPAARGSRGSPACSRSAR